MKELGLTVDRQTAPLSMQLSTNEAELGDSNAYPVKVNKQLKGNDVINQFYVQVVLQCTSSESSESSTETVDAKYVVGADGGHDVAPVLQLVILLFQALILGSANRWKLLWKAVRLVRLNILWHNPVLLAYSRRRIHMGRYRLHSPNRSP